MTNNPTLFTSPIKTLYIFTLVAFNFLKQFIQMILRLWYLVVLFLIILVFPRYFPGDHYTLYTKIDEISYFMAYWILLGIASSVGLGTGLHTFVLYLGPHIAKMTLYSYECNSIPLMTPSKWNVEQFTCPKDPQGTSFFDILLNVQFEAFLWGLGTAIGELPPYFVARAAALANQNSEELEELKQKKQKNLIDKAKLLIYNQLQRHAFITVLLCASIPNPLFDLAGLTCGHFLIPFMTFFGATSIGKAVIKVHIQMLFVIFIFSKEHVESLVSLVSKYLPLLSEQLRQQLEKQKATLHDPSLFKEGDKPLLAQIWDYFIFGMIAFFLVSIINSLVAQYCEDHQEKEKKEKSKKKK